MKRFNHLIALGSYLALASSGMALGTGCAVEPGVEEAATEEVAIQIRFHDEENALDQQQTFGLLGALAPIEYTDVDRILVDVTYTSNDQPFAVNFDLTQKATNVWEGTLPFLPRNEQLRFTAEASDANGTIIFSGETLATLTIDNQAVVIPLAPAQDQETFDMPRMYRIVYPTEVVEGQEVQIIFTIEGNPGETINYAITSADGTTPFSPSAGSVTLTNTVADFITVYTAPEVGDGKADFTHEVLITSADSLSSVAIATNFTTTVAPRAAGIDGVINTRPSVLFNPVVKELEANGTLNANEVQLTADVSDDGDAALRTYQWSFTPNTGTATATFADTTANPGIMQGYTVDHQGTITLAVTDENGGTTTLYYELLPNQFADAIDHGSANGFKKIVSGDAHTCVLTGEGKVRCWGHGQFGQLGYGNAANVGDTSSTLPYTAGDIPLPVADDGTPADPVIQLVAGNNHTCARLESGLVYCWGENGYGQLGYNTTDDLGDGESVISFGYVTLGGLASKIAAGGNHTCAILQESGALRCWGRNNLGQLGRNHVNNIGDDETVFDAGNVDLGTVTITDIALGNDHTCALLSTGNIRCWGDNGNGQLGYGDNLDRGDDEAIDTLADVSLPGPVRKVAAGAHHTCVHLDNGAMRCWGYQGHGATGYGISNSNFGDQSGEVPLNLADIAVGAPVTDIAVGDFHTCALLSDGNLKCWGEGANGRLGYGNQTDLGTPAASGVDLQGTSAYQLTAGAAHTCALRSNGTARCWGAGANGRLGLGNTSDVYSPAAGSDIAILAAPTP